MDIGYEIHQAELLSDDRDINLIENSIGTLSLGGNVLNGRQIKESYKERMAYNITITEEDSIKIKFKGNLIDRKSAYETISELYYIFKSEKRKDIYVDFSNVEFISANLFAVLGACIFHTRINAEQKRYYTNINTKIESVMTRNGFSSLFGIKEKNDDYKNCVRYKVFGAQTEQLEEFERYLLIYIFNHDGMPFMSESYKHRMIDVFMEMFNNVIDHADSKYIFVCGHFFRKKKELLFSIVDIGYTFEQKITEYFKGRNEIAPPKSIEWAIKLGNSTKINEPGGIGLAELLDFLDKNKGRITIVSGSEFFTKHSQREETMGMKNFFPGTIVTIGMRLNDTNFYLYDSDKDETIVF